jgi:hypothetical protein
MCLLRMVTPATLYDKDAIKKMNEYFASRQGKPSNIQEVMDLYHSEKLGQLYL